MFAKLKTDLTDFRIDLEIMTKNVNFFVSILTKTLISFWLNFNEKS